MDKILIICLTIIIIIGGVSYLIWNENISESPYEQCLEFCEGGYFNTRTLCLETCHDDFKEILVQFRQGQQDQPELPIEPEDKT